MVDLVPVDHDPFVPPSDLAKQVAGFPDRAADLTMAALGPLGEAGMTLGDALRTGHLDTRDIPQIAGGVMLGAAAPETEEAAPLEAGAQTIAKGIRAYHGSPYDFDRFDLSKIGTGEGAQAYGHGLYFAENPEVAETYKPGYGFKFVDSSGKEIPKSGKTYEVSIAADPEHFLDWDKPLSEQSSQVKQKLQDSALHLFGSLPWDEKRPMMPTEGSAGRDIYQALESNAVRRNALENPTHTLGFGELNALPSNALRQAGIPGIKYLDQGSRGSGAGTHNYVLFDDKLVDIIKKYGLAGLIAGGASHFSTQPVDHDPFSE